MNTDPREHTPRRIIVALDAGTASRPALESVVRLAAELRAELLGLFIEESDLLDLAALPMTRAIPTHGIGEAFLDATVMRRALRARSAALRLALEELSARSEVVARFEVVQGLPGEQLSRHVRKEDLLTLGGERYDATALDIVKNAPCAVLRLRRRAAPSRQTTLVVDNGEKDLLAAGLLLARAFNSRLKILIPSTADPGRHDQIADWLAGHHARADINHLGPDTDQDPNAAAEAYRPGTVVYDRASAFGRMLDPRRTPDCSFLAY